MKVPSDSDLINDALEVINETGIPGGNMPNDENAQLGVLVQGDVNEGCMGMDGGVNWVKATKNVTTGVWNDTWPGTVPDDDYTLNVKATDNAGNT
ncbi:Ig-like domain-containing protein, partial [Salmonella enterica]|uniref:Ig-like domain-containing protein n=1 Tax=Salmonella enterica TaxID=28901 RepID=UPI00398C6E03